MADQSFVDYMRRFLTRVETEEAYKTAGAAFLSNHTEVTITSSSMDGASHSGEFRGDPKKIMDACEYLLQEYEAADAGTVQQTATGAMDFSTRIVGT